MPEPPSIKVWDLPTRLFHWSLLALLCFSWWSGEEGEMDLHMYSGYAILTLLLFRIAWGVVGSRSARFVDFVRPVAAIGYVPRLLAMNPPKHAGHNPLGGLMIAALLLTVLTLAVTGLFANDDIFTEGPLVHHVSKSTSDFLTGIHHDAFTVLQVLVVLHIVAVLFYGVALDQDLLMPMLTGRKPLQGLEHVAPPRLHSPMLALAVLAAAAVVVWLLVTWM